MFLLLSTALAQEPPAPLPTNDLPDHLEPTLPILLLPQTTTTTTTTSVTPNQRPLPVYAISGSVALLGGSLAAWGAARQNLLIEQAVHDKDEQALYAAGARGTAFSALAWTLWGVGVTGITAEFVLPLPER